MRISKEELLQTAIISARVIACGTPKKDESGNFTGWELRPDKRMRKFLIDTVGDRAGINPNEPTTEEEAFKEAESSLEVYMDYYTKHNPLDK